MFEIRQVAKADIPLLRELVYKVWPQTYTGLLSQDQIDYMLELMYSESSLKKQMDDGAEFIFIYDNDEPVGYASWQEMESHVYKLHKIYVLPSQQGKGTGRFMIDYIIGKIKQVGARALQLQVNRSNKARSFYEKLGFEVIDE